MRRPQSADICSRLARCSCESSMQFLNKDKPPKGGQYCVCSKAARNDGCENKHLWNARNVERYVLQQIDPARVVAPFEPAEKRRGPSPQEFDLMIAERIGGLFVILRRLRPRCIHSSDRRSA